MSNWYKKSIHEVRVQKEISKTSGYYDDIPSDFPDITDEDLERILEDTSIFPSTTSPFIPVPRSVMDYSKPPNDVTDVSVIVEKGKARMKYKGANGQYYISVAFPAVTYSDWEKSLQKFLQVPPGKPLEDFRQWLHSNFGIQHPNIKYDIQQNINGDWESIFDDSGFETRAEAEAELASHLSELREAVEAGDLDDFAGEEAYRIVPIETFVNPYKHNRRAMNNRKFIKKAGFLDDIPSDLPEITDSEEWMDIIRNANPPDIVRKENKFHEAIYTFKGVDVYLWIDESQGRIPVLSFENGACSVYYRDVKVPPKDSYQVLTYDVLPEGRLTLEKFVEENLPKKILKEEREEQIPYVKVSSQKKDPVTGIDINIRLLLKPYGVGLFELFDGPDGTQKRVDISLFHPWWAHMKQFLRSMHEYRELHNIEDLTEEQFQKFLEMLREGEIEGAFVGELQW